MYAKNKEVNESKADVEQFLKPNYDVAVITIDKDNIGSFVPIESMKRAIRKPHVNSIIRSLNIGNHFDVPIVIEKWNNHMYVLDGNHRITAIREWLRDGDGYNNKKINVVCAIFTKQNDEQRREVYHTWNIPIRQNTDDFVCAYKDFIPIYPKITTELPCDIYGDRNQIKFKHFVGGYMTAKFSGDFQGGFQGSAKEFVDKSIGLVAADVDIIKEFWEDIVRAFNIPIGTENMRQVPMLRTSPFYALFRLWYVNKDILGREEIIARFSLRQVLRTIEEYAPLGGRESCKEALIQIKDKLNAKYQDQPSLLFIERPIRS